ncbi:radical SAM protein [Anaerospora hongkongensis]|uniref:radical SAM protein n=1 Tax=Anaerospora hongkongensis TaxID=244830 RepID=UPI0028987747|nr:radical SAM protein [Anaerospora hongkongensis]
MNLRATNIQTKSDAIGKYLKTHDLDVFTSLHTIIINISEACNRKCSFCPRGNGYTSPSYLSQFMDIKVIAKLVEQLRNKFQGTFSLSGFGEPALHPYLQELIYKLKECDKARVLLTTNGDFHGRLVDLEVDNIDVSLYDESAELKIKDLNTKSPLQFKTQYKENNTFWNNRAGNVGKSDVHIPSSCCNICFMKITIDINGDILQCCSDWSREHILGNIFTDDIYEIWINRLKEDRMHLIGDRRELCKLCSKCDSPGNLYGEEFKNFWSDYYEKHQS